jgi:hypothetical protein
VSEQVRPRNYKVWDNVQKRPRGRVKAFHAGDDEVERRTAGGRRTHGCDCKLVNKV